MVHKPLNTRGLLPFFWQFLRPHWLGVAIILFTPCLLVIESTLVPYVMRIVVNAVTTPDADKANIWHTVRAPMLTALIAYGIMMLGFRTQELVGNVIYPKIQAAIRLRTFDYVQHHSHQFFSDQFAGSLATKIGDLPRTFQAMFFFIQWQVIGSLAVLIGTLGVMATMDARVTAAIAAWVLFHVGITLFTARRVNELSSQNADDRSNLSGKITDALSNITSVRLFAAHTRELDYLRHHQSSEQRSHRAMLMRISLIRWVQDFAILLVLAAVGYGLISGWQRGWITPGDFVYIFYGTLNILFFVWHNSSLIPNFFSEAGVARKALEILQQPHDLVDAESATMLNVTRGEIAFENVHFSYLEGRNIFADKSLTIRAGEKIGLVGFSGSGKSTFAHLILRLYDVQQGRILIDGQDIAHATQSSLHAAISMLPQDTSLFHRSLMENIRYGNPTATDAQVIEAAKQAHAHEFIATLPQGYETLVGERGIKLSGGQRQRIAIARAILKNAPILILDEATSALDSITEKEIQQSLESLMRGRTTILIAHRLSTLAGMDRILVFHEGQIIEDGSHAELLTRKGHYAKLWDMQAGGFLPEL